MLGYFPFENHAVLIESGVITVVSAVRSEPFCRVLRVCGFAQSTSPSNFTGRMISPRFTYALAPEKQQHANFQGKTIVPYDRVIHKGCVTFYTELGIANFLLNCHYSGRKYDAFTADFRKEFFSLAVDTIKAGRFADDILTVEALMVYCELATWNHLYNIAKAAEGYGIQVPKAGPVSPEQIAAYVLASKSTARDHLAAACQKFFPHRKAKTVRRMHDDEFDEPATGVDLSFMD